MKFPWFRLGTVGVLLSQAACAGSEPATDPGGGVVSVALASGNGKLSLQVGETVVFTVTTNIEGPYVLHWSSSNPERLSVDQTGTVTGLAVGTASVIVTLELTNGREFFGRADVTIVP